NRILYLQLALGVIIASVLLLAAEVAEREQMAVELAGAETEKAAALGRARLLEREQRARAEAGALARGAPRFAAATTLREVTEAAVAVLAGWGAGMSTFYYVEGDELVLLAAEGVEAPLRERYARTPLVVECPSSDAARLGAPVVTNVG